MCGGKIVWVKKKKEHFINGIKVTEEVAQSILSKSTYFANDAKYLELYNDFVSQQKEPFIAIMYYLKDSQMKKLSSEETLKKLYPFLDITKKKKHINDDLGNVKI